MGEVFEIEIDTLETTCHALDPTPVANCSVRQLRDHVSGTLRVAAGSGPASSTVVLHRAGPFIQLPSLPSWLADVQFLKLPALLQGPHRGFISLGCGRRL